MDTVTDTKTLITAVNMDTDEKCRILSLYNGCEYGINQIITIGESILRHPYHGNFRILHPQIVF